MKTEIEFFSLIPTTTSSFSCFHENSIQFIQEKMKISFTTELKFLWPKGVSLIWDSFINHYVLSKKALFFVCTAFGTKRLWF